ADRHGGAYRTAAGRLRLRLPAGLGGHRAPRLRAADARRPAHGRPSGCGAGHRGGRLRALRALPVLAAQTALPRPLPLAAVAPDALRVLPRAPPRPARRTPPRRLLPGLLLVPVPDPDRRGRDERRRDARARRGRAAREAVV